MGQGWERKKGGGKKGTLLVLAYMYTPDIKSWIKHCAEPNPNAAFVTNDQNRTELSDCTNFL